MKKNAEIEIEIDTTENLSEEELEAWLKEMEKVFSYKIPSFDKYR